MSERKRAALLVALRDKLYVRGSWCGETHLQKAAYFLQELLGVPLGFRFILYKYGPFSGELRRELGSMRSDGFLELVPQPAPYGPKLHATPVAERQLMGRWPKTLGRYDNHLDFVAEKLGRLGVAPLERLATALWVWREMPGADEATRAQRINELKPHVSVDQARDALRRVSELEHEARSLPTV